VSPIDRIGQSGWVQLGTIAMTIIAAAIAVGVLKSDISHLQEEMTQKADATEVRAQYQAILRELDLLHQEVRSIGPARIGRSPSP